MMKFRVCGRFATGSCRCWDEKGICERAVPVSIKTRKCRDARVSETERGAKRDAPAGPGTACPGAWEDQRPSRPT